MRILFSFVGGLGHFQPLVPIARAARVAGHDVSFTCDPSMVAAVAGEGFACVPTVPGPARAPRRRPLLAVDAEREDRVLREHFARHSAARRATGILALCGSSRPDLIVCDETDFGAMIAAERLALPHATVLVNATGSFVRAAVVAEALSEVRAEHGLPADPHLAMPGRHLVLSPFPPIIRDPDAPLPAGTFVFGPAANGDRATPPWRPPRPQRATIYVTLGTAFNVESGDLFSRLLAGLRDLDVNLVATVGRGIDPAELGPQPSNVLVETYIPQAAVLPHCRLVVSHGGSGSVIGALTFGLPMVLVPMGADQPLNAARCAALGLARVLDAVDATAEDIHEAAVAVLADASYVRAASRVRDEIVALPPAAAAVARLEALAAS